MHILFDRGQRLGVAYGEGVCGKHDVGCGSRRTHFQVVVRGAAMDARTAATKLLVAFCLSTYAAVPSSNATTFIPSAAR